MVPTLGQAFRDLIATLHSHIDTDHVERFAAGLEALEDRVNGWEHAATRAGADWIEGHVVPVVQELAELPGEPDAP